MVSGGLVRTLVQPLATFVGLLLIATTAADPLPKAPSKYGPVGGGAAVTLAALAVAGEQRTHHVRRVAPEERALRLSALGERGGVAALRATLAVHAHAHAHAHAHVHVHVHVMCMCMLCESCAEPMPLAPWNAASRASSSQEAMGPPEAAAGA